MQSIAVAIIFSSSGSLGEAGSSMFAFDYKGVVIVPKDSIPKEIDVEELAIEVVSSICFVCRRVVHSIPIHSA